MDLKFYWKLVVRRMPWMAGLFLIFMLVAIVVALRLPAVYTTSAQLLVEPPQIVEAGTTPATSDAEQLEIIEQRLMVRANLIDIANRFDVFGAGVGMDPDTVVRQMRELTQITRVSGRDRATLMAISFTAEAPTVVAEVVNQYVTLILNENARLNTRRAESNLTFFEQEVNRLAAELEDQSARILQFKTDNLDALPDGQEFRLDRQSLLQERIARAEQEIAALDRQKDSVIRVYNSTGRLQELETDRRTPEERRLEELQEELRAALAVYSDQHPLIVQLRAQEENLRIQISQNAAESSSATVDAESTFSPLDATIAQIDTSITTNVEQIERTREELLQLQRDIAATPSNSIALEGLERRFDTLQGQYDASVERLNTARLEERIVASARGQRITVLEQATVPNDPSSPNRPMIIAAGLGVGLAAAASLFMLLEFLNTTIRRPTELVSKLGVTPFVTIPYLENPRRKLFRRGMLIASFLVVVIAVPVFLWAVDTYYQPLDLLAERVLRLVGV